MLNQIKEHLINYLDAKMPKNRVVMVLATSSNKDAAKIHEISTKKHIEILGYNHLGLKSLLTDFKIKPIFENLISVYVDYENGNIRLSKERTEQTKYVIFFRYINQHDILVELPNSFNIESYLAFQKERKTGNNAYLILDMEKIKLIYEENFVDYEGFRYWYEYREGKHRVDMCLSTEDPKKYCNGFHIYQDKDPGNGSAFVVTKTSNPGPEWSNIQKHE